LLLRRFASLRASLYLAIRGSPAPIGASDDDCCVCYGVGIESGGNDNGEDELSHSGTDDGSSMGILETFCKVSHHVAHRPCMYRWITTGGMRSRVVVQLGEGLLGTGMVVAPVPTCPSCRGDLVFEIVGREELERGGGVRGVVYWWKTWRKMVALKWAYARFGLTLGYVLLVWSVCKGKEEARRRWGSSTLK
jgi:hypothetical protein